MKPLWPVQLSSGLGSERARCQVKFGNSFCDGVEVLDVEGLAHGAGAVPEADLAVGLEALELVEDVRAHRGHAGAAADEHHLVLGVTGEELAEGARDGDLVAGLPAVDERGHDAGRGVGTFGGGVAMRTFSMMMPNSSG
jgi:hypothetical protein